MEKPKKTKKIQCLQEYLECKIIKQDRADEGYCEPQCMDLDVGDIIQFERYGFVKLEKKNSGLGFIYCHK